MNRLLKPFAAVLLACGLMAVVAAPELIAGPKDAEAKKWLDQLKKAKAAKEKAEAIEQIGKLALINTKLGEPAVADIKAALKDKDVEVRKAAALAYGRCDPEETGAAKELAELLKDKDDGVKTNAALGLAAMGAKAKDAIPALKAASKATEDKKQDRIYKDAMKSISGQMKKKD
jgi:HEAT repeat protein